MAINDDEDSHDEEYYIEQAKKLSLMDGGVHTLADPNETPEINAHSSEQQVDLKDVVNTDFMKDLVGELGLDIAQEGLGDLVGEEEKKDEEKKDDPANKNGDAAGNGDAK